jgi:hypothetical protein
MIRSEGPFTARNGRSGQNPIVAQETRKMRPEQGYLLPFSIFINYFQQFHISKRFQLRHKLAQQAAHCTEAILPPPVFLESC